MLPFLKKTQEASASAPVESIELKTGENELDELEVAAEDLIKAIHSRDIKAVAEALRAAFELADSEPHVEGEHIEE